MSVESFFEELESDTQVFCGEAGTPSQGKTIEANASTPRLKVWWSALFSDVQHAQKLYKWRYHQKEGCTVCV
jgi:hypothetical protein